MNRRLLAVVAHPDDETFGMGGTLAHYAEQGVEVHLVCATRGEVGEVDPDMLDGYQSVGDLREHELCCAADVLGLKKVHFLDYRDSGMPKSPENEHPRALIRAPLTEVAEKIAFYIRDIKPQVVITFDPMGGYGHPDHIAVHKAVVEAFEMSGNASREINNLEAFSPDKLYFHIFPRKMLRWIVKFMPLFGQDPSRFGKNADIDLTSIISTTYPEHARVNYRKVAKKREKASACYASQGGDQQSGYFLSWLLRIFRSTESFMRAYPLPETPYKIEKDLFNGINTG